MKRFFFFALIVVAVACSSKKKYDPFIYYDKEEQQWILSRIVAHIFTAPPYVAMKDRLKPEHNDYYWGITFNFDFLKLYVGKDSTHYFLVRRPAPGTNNRAVGGTFKIKGKELVQFKEVFITPTLPAAELTERSEFLFDQLVEDDINQYLKMPSYVQWPNEAAYYDTIDFEWKLKPEVVLDSAVNQ